jgi:hypothetical protein
MRGSTQFAARQELACVIQACDLRLGDQQWIRFDVATVENTRLLHSGGARSSILMTAETADSAAKVGFR